jgi:hypothetical protein
VPPAKYRNKEACHQAGYLDADDYPVPDRRGISMNNTMRPPVQKIRVDVLDFSLDKAMAQFAAAIDAQIDRDDASDDFIKEKLHSIIRPSGTDAMTRPYHSSIGRVTAVLAFGYPVWVWPDLVSVQLQERSRLADPGRHVARSRSSRLTR